MRITQRQETKLLLHFMYFCLFLLFVLFMGACSKEFEPSKMYASAKAARVGAAHASDIDENSSFETAKMYDSAKDAKAGIEAAAPAAADTSNKSNASDTAENSSFEPAKMYATAEAAEAASETASATDTSNKPEPSYTDVGSDADSPSDADYAGGVSDTAEESSFEPAEMYATAAAASEANNVASTEDSTDTLEPYDASHSSDSEDNSSFEPAEMYTTAAAARAAANTVASAEDSSDTLEPYVPSHSSDTEENSSFEPAKMYNTVAAAIAGTEAASLPDKSDASDTVANSMSSSNTSTVAAASSTETTSVATASSDAAPAQESEPAPSSEPTPKASPAETTPVAAALPVAEPASTPAPKATPKTTPKSKPKSVVASTAAHKRKHKHKDKRAPAPAPAKADSTAAKEPDAAPAKAVSVALKTSTADDTSASSTDSNSQNDTPSSTRPSDTEVAMVEKTIEALAKHNENKSKPNIADAVRAPKVVAECKKEPYVKLDAQARASMEKGKEATEAGKYGVGFKNVAEYKRWGAMHNTVFNGVSKACAQLSDCTKKHPKDKNKRCGGLKQTYTDWEHSAKQFTKLVKSVETTQPPPLCSSPLSMDDPGKCFSEMANKVDNVCTSDECKDASGCWRSVNILYGAINQEESACKYMRTKLSDCNGYQEALRRRKAAFERCKYSMDKAGLKLAPVM